MSKRTVFTTITPLPPSIARATAIAFLHDHLGMIDLNPLIVARARIPPPAHAAPEERACTWYRLTDKVSYLPGGLAASDVSYTCAFHDLPTGLQTHCYAPLGLDIRDRWSVAGSLPGEPREPVELGLGAPLTGLYVREDVDMRCNIVMAGFVKKTLKKSHAILVEKLAAKAETIAAHQQTQQQQQQPQQPLCPVGNPQRLSWHGSMLNLQPQPQPQQHHRQSPPLPPPPSSSCPDVAKPLEQQHPKSVEMADTTRPPGYTQTAELE
ncbi:hypothetical protein TOPH_06643 [Tolypocladium ophioglossoides CBS 100239]|uniref:DUF7053 domain-containing protein n=1 Tax=Tolypocladium ophioglossoides (strain CBS 100239) TaxID=1163406 RepID=A0A0L0N3Y6_TOLOC|nr:hypothetical protein TOPH_06643 [Tolypocladium ophioglossoides CBS 100239]